MKSWHRALEAIDIESSLTSVKITDRSARDNRSIGCGSNSRLALRATATMSDVGFLADAERASLDIAPLTGEELEKTVLGVLKTSPALLAKLKQMIAPQ